MGGALLFCLLITAAPVESLAEDDLPLPGTAAENPQSEGTAASDDKADTVKPGAEDNLPSLGTGEETEQSDDTAASNDTEAPEDVNKPAVADTCDRIKDLPEKESSWYDSAHAYMNTAFCEPAVWFDDFFASDRMLEEAAGSYVRWRNDFTQNEESGFDFITNLNFSVELPKISSKLKLIFEGDEDPTLQDVLPSDQAEASKNNLGLRLDVKETDRSNFNISVSAKPRVRARYRYTYPVSDDFLIRFTQEIQNEEGVNGARTRLDLEKAFLPFKLLRSTTELFVTEDYSGAEWSQSFVLFQRLSKKSSFSYEASAVGITEPEDYVTNYRLGLRYRRSIHRDWLFFEVSPDISWPITLSEDRAEVLKERRSVLAILLRIEVHFGNAERRKYSDYY